MNDEILRRVLVEMTNPENDGLPQKEVAKKVGIHPQTLRNYLTKEVWADIRKIRLDVVADELSLIDRALYAKAVKGDVSAAKLLYSRWEACRNDVSSLQNDTELPQTLEEIEQEIEALKQEIATLEPEKDQTQEPQEKTA